MILDPKMLVILAIFLVIILFGGSIWDTIDESIQTFISGPEYCFRDVTQSDVSIATQGISVSYTKTDGDELCFRTKDSSIVERLNQQVQDRKLQTQLAQIEANKQFMNETLPKLIIFGLITLIIIVIIVALSNRNSGRGFY